MSIEKNYMNPFHNIRPHYLVSLALVLATCAVYFQVGQFEFIDYDDDLYVTGNHIVKAGLSPKGFRWAFKATYAANWHPLTWLSHMLDVQLYGLNPGAHHLTNLLFHILNTVLLFHFLWKITGALWRSALVAALFSLHPLHVESVAWIAERKDVLSAFFWMLTLLLYTGYVRRPAIPKYLMVFLCFSLGLMSKPMLVTVPVILLLLDYWPLGRFQIGPRSDDKDARPGRSILFLVYEKVPFFILSAAASAVTIWAQHKGGAMSSIEVVPIGVRIANALVSYAAYIGKTIWPSKLAVIYPYSHDLPLWQIIGASFILIFISLLAFRQRRRPFLAVGWLWYLITLIPVIGLVQVGSEAMADRYTYIPLIGLFIMVAWGVDELLKQWRYRRLGLVAAIGAVLLILTMISWRQIGYWQDSIKLFQHSITATKDNVKAHNNLGIAFVNKGDPYTAIHHYLIALKKAPNDEIIYCNLGNALSKIGKITEAEACYHKTLSLNPRKIEAHNNLANMLARNGKTAQAIQHYLEALNINPEYTDAYYNLGNVFMEQGRFEEAVEQYLTVLRIDPYYAAAQKNFAVTLAKQSVISGDLKGFSDAAALNSDDISLKDHLKNMHRNMKKIEASIAEMQILHAKKPYDPEVLLIIGSLHKRKGDLKSAETYYQKAISIEPEYYEAIKNMAITKVLQGEFDQARNLFKAMLTLQPKEPEGYYLIAQTYARQNKTDMAAEWLEMAAVRGFEDWTRLKNDISFDKIKHTPTFQKIVNGR